ncbi:HDOD domain-containing protein, partial [Colwellia psychrerythraea]
FFFSKQNKKKPSKHQYSSLVDKHNLAHSTQRKKSTAIRAINQEFIDESTIFKTPPLDKANITPVVPEGFLSFKVFTPKMLGSKQQQVVSDIIQSFRKPHPLLFPLTQRTFEPNELFELIKTDAEITAKILKAVNSSMFSVQKPITDIHHAIIYMGVGKVKSIALQCTMNKGVKFTDKAQNEAYNKLWKASYLASSFCLLFAKETGENNPAELATHCLLSYLGDLAILSYKPSLASYYLGNFTLFERTKVFQASLGINSAIIGKFLAQQWQLPLSIESGIEHSILPLTNSMASSDIPDDKLRQLLLCYLACRLGDLVAFNGLNEVPALENVSFESLGKVEFYYTQKNIQNTDFTKINLIVAKPDFRKRINKIISKIN